jgi:hypothetical protein
MIINPAGLGHEEDRDGETQQQLGKTGPSSRQRGRHTSTNPQQTGNNNNLVMGGRWMPDSKTDWPADRRPYQTFDFDFG